MESPPAPAQPDKDHFSRLEKLAATHFDRAQTFSSGTTKTALAWTVALALVWFQVLEHRLKLIRDEQLSRGQLVSVVGLRPAEFGADRMIDRAEESTAKVNQAEAAAASPTIELPFSIKLTLPPHWVATLWLLLALGLAIYLDVSRRRIFRLIVRGIELSEESGVRDDRFRTLVGGGVWWLAPIRPVLSGSLSTDSIRTTLGWSNLRARTAVVAGIAATVFLLQARVQYLSLCVAAHLLHKNAPPGLTSIGTISWLGLTAFNLLLGALIALVIWRWFSNPGAVPNIASGQAEVNMSRRRALSAGGAAGFALLGFGSNLAALYGFGSLNSGRKLGFTPAKPNENHVRSRRRRGGLSKRGKLATLAYGLYMNPKSGVVHIATGAVAGKTALCASCIREPWAQRLKALAPNAVLWNRGNHQLHAAIESMPRVKTVMGSPAAPITKVIPRPHIAHRTFMVEQQTVAYLHHGGPKVAIRFLSEAVQAVPEFGIQSGMRLYDLLAGLSIRYQDAESLNQLTHILQSEISKLQNFLNRSEHLPNRAEPATNRYLDFALSLTGLERLFNSGSKSTSPKATQRPRVKQRKADLSGVPANHEAYLLTELQSRLGKWSQSKSDWSLRWRKSEAVVWAGITLPAL
ncbi:hypothetical protein [Paludibaculum fermentans]|uniref:hypothetical protein n=1 Tax=Paludibaculum fermentans TaxID=1473598 RepID=UPI003EBD28FD